MGLFDFLKGKGKKVGAAEAGEPPAKEELEKEIADLGLDKEGLEIEVEGDKVRLKGTPKDQETKEKLILAMGNVEGVAKVEDETPGSEPVFHTVESGDTLSKIAQTTLGDASRYPEIFEANKPMLTDPDKIYPGQVLRIPQS
ncbi:peptidoglycan-binding protein LysM [Amaricoccus macauensis]|uniref:peptidoglycan-binding protein LysM n=1 Tax=Amaricoccus macauensis TaxID=57001 RepID=UPI003C7D6196